MVYIRQCVSKILTNRCLKNVYSRYTSISAYHVYSNNLYAFSNPKFPVASVPGAWTITGKRQISSNDSKPSELFSVIGTGPYIVWPGFFKSLKNLILEFFIIRPYFDSEFSLGEFIRGARQALLLVSSLLSQGKYEELNGLLTSDCSNQLRAELQDVSLKQKLALSIIEGDIYLSFPYEVGIILYDENKVQKRFVEITMCYHIFPGLGALKGVANPEPSDVETISSKATVWNCRFVREFTKGIEDSWVINSVLIFSPKDKSRRR